VYDPDLGRVRGDQGRAVAGRDGESVECPGGVAVAGVTDRLEPGRLAGVEADVESVQGEGESQADGLDEGLLAGPAVKEGLGLEVRGQLPEGLLLGGGEVPCRQLVKVAEARRMAISG
jgi:hypothetical protein